MRTPVSDSQVLLHAPRSALPCSQQRHALSPAQCTPAPARNCGCEFGEAAGGMPDARTCARYFCVSRTCPPAPIDTCVLYVPDSPPVCSLAPVQSSLCVRCASSFYTDAEPYHVHCSCHWSNISFPWILGVVNWGGEGASWQFSLWSICAQVCLPKLNRG